ncbi:MAG: bacillithiol biosynthesis protein BshC [Gemmatimonadaceae bacterium]
MSAARAAGKGVGAQVITEPLGGSPLSRAMQQRSLTPTLHPWSPETKEEWAAHVTRARRRAATDWYARIESAIDPRGPAATRVARVVAERGVLVTTGQQAALFGGPLYTIAKALTALTLADAIEAQLGVPAAPLFWAATDDADWVEARAAHVADGDGLHELALAAPPPAGTIMAHVKLPRHEMRALTAGLKRSCGSATDPRYLALASAAFSAGTLGGAYVSFLRELLQPLGIAVFDSSHDAYRQAARPMLLGALASAEAIARALAEQAAEIRRAGFEPQVQDERGLSLVFEIVAGTKRRLAIDEAKRAGDRTTALAPNVLLRPLVERELMPTVTYVGGPGEIAYFTQTNAVARSLDCDPLVVAPRWSGTVIEPFAARALRRLGVEWRDVKDLHTLERRLAAAALPRDVAAAWKRLREQLHASMRDVADAVGRHDLLEPPVLEGLERGIEHRLSRGERRLLAAVKRREERTRRDLGAVSAALFPLGGRQERVLNYVPMLCREGETLMQQLRSAAAEHAASVLRAAPAEAVAAL